MSQYGSITYLILFGLIFLETGFVITPFLPGDSLIFVAGAIVAASKMNFFLLLFLLILAAILGDSVNYWIGNVLGRKLSHSRLIKKEYLTRTEQFYKRNGGKTIIFARFIPIIRTFAPFIAGIGEMDYLRFFAFNVIGAILWVLIFLTAGYLFGNIQVIQNNLTLIVWAIIFVSLIPAIYHYIKSKLV
jgi:membrane-associated protein